MLRILPRRTEDGAAALQPRPNASEAAQAGKAALLLITVGLLTGVSNLAFNVLVARLSGADAYGTFVALLTLSQIAGVLAVATNYTVARRVARADHLTGALIRRSLVSSWPWLLVGAGLFAVTPLLQGYVHLRSPAAVLTADGVFIVIVTSAVPNGLLIGLRRFRTLALLNFVGALARLAVIPFLPSGPNATVGALAASAVPFLIIGPSALIIVLLSRRRIPMWQTARAGDQDASPLSLETMGAALLAAMLWSLWSIPPLIARNGLDGLAAGDFSATQLLAGGILFLSTPAITAFFPITARGRSLRTVMLGLGGLVGLCSFAVVVLALLGPRLMGPLFGPGYSSPVLLFAALGTSAALVAVANFGAWMARAMHRLVWVAFAGSAAALASELVIGLLLHPLPLGLALLPATAVVVGLSVVTIVVPEPVYNGAITFARRAIADLPKGLSRGTLGELAAAMPRRPKGQKPPAAAGSELGAVQHPRAAAAHDSRLIYRQSVRLADAIWTPRYRFAAVVGLLAIAFLGLAGDTGAIAGVLGSLAVGALIFSTVLAFAACRSHPAPWQQIRARFTGWFWAFVIVAEVATAAVQSWFRPGTAIAGTDSIPPDGTAWLARLFDPWSWTGSDIGSAAANQRQLPWASTLAVVHGLGGSADLAQRVWLTLLFVGMGVAAVALLRTLGLRPFAATIGGLVYLFNPLTMVTVPADAFLLAMALLPALSAMVLAAARGTIRIRTGVVLMVLTVPFLGYVEVQPALTLLLAVAVLLCPLLAWWLGGSRAFWRGARVVGVGGALVLLGSAFWLVPAAIRTGASPPTQLTSLTGWMWTEVRATIANGFWLNTTWAWSSPSVYPYADTYSQQPLMALKYALPVIAFSALLIPAAMAGHVRHVASQLRVGVAAAAVALFFIIFSTGTNPPGSLIFDLPYYHLPFGFLLREPDSHFLFVAPLAYAVLIAVGAHYLIQLVHTRQRDDSKRLRPRVLGRAALIALGVAIATLVPTYPLFTGAVIADSRPGYPPRHVSVPSFWYDMADFVNAEPSAGDILALPADHFNQVDYTWGYYGTDNFIQDLMSRRIVMNLPSVYVTTNPQLGKVVDEIDADIVAHRWTEATTLVSALHTPYVLVRGDVNPSFTGSTAVPSPRALASALSQAPGFVLVHRAGPLQLFGLQGMDPAEFQTVSAIATVNSSQPDLHVLPYLPAGTQLVTSPVRAGLPSVTQVPSVTRWNDFGAYIATTIQEPPGWDYQVVWLNRDPAKEGVINVIPQGPFARLTIPTTSVLGGGDFASGPWQDVADCNGANGFAKSQLTASVDPRGGPDGEPSLRLGALLDAACEQQPLSWSGGPILVRLVVRNDSGLPARICLYELPQNKCAPADALPSSRQWSKYASLVTPDTGTEHVALYLLTDGSAAVPPSLNEFADITASQLPIAAPSLAVVGTPTSGFDASQQLVVQDEAYDAHWSAPGGASHVAVNGLLNGWLTNDPGGLPSHVSYGPSRVIALSNVVSAMAGLVTLGIAVSLLPFRALTRRGRR